MGNRMDYDKLNRKALAREPWEYSKSKKRGKSTFPWSNFPESADYRYPEGAYGVIRSYFDSTCDTCGEKISKGQFITYDGSARHTYCGVCKHEYIDLDDMCMDCGDVVNV